MNNPLVEKRIELMYLRVAGIERPLWLWKQ
jgi:hypothetical protein